MTILKTQIDIGTIRKFNISMEQFTPFVPTLNYSNWKGKHGKIGIIGGCLEYTGAPYFAAAAVLKLGGDLSHLFCTKDAGIPIKSYDPDIIVHPYLLESNSIFMSKPTQKVIQIQEEIKKISEWMPVIDAFCIGPGIGRDPLIIDFIHNFLSRFTKLYKPIIIDGDALYAITQNPKYIYGCENVILTPNQMELSRLKRKFNTSSIEKIAQELGGITIVSKGKYETFSNGKKTKEIKINNLIGCPRRTGGQGDIFAGTLTLFTSWVKNPKYYLNAAEATSEAVKKAAKLAYQKYKIGTTAKTILKELPNVIPESWYQ